MATNEPQFDQNENAQPGPEYRRGFHDSHEVDRLVILEHLEEIRRLRAELEEWKSWFKLRWDADQRAIKRWQESTGKVLVWPDHADLCVWLMEQLADEEAACDEAQKKNSGFVGEDQQRCQACNRADGISFEVDDAIWERVSRRSDEEALSVLCLVCFDKRAAELGINGYRIRGLSFTGLHGTSYNTKEEETVELLSRQLAEANAALERAEAKCAASQPIMKIFLEEILNEPDVQEEFPTLVTSIEGILSDNPGQPLLDNLARVEALIAKWPHRKGCAAIIYDERATHDYCPPCELRQALKGEPHD